MATPAGKRRIIRRIRQVAVVCGVLFVLYYTGALMYNGRLGGGIRSTWEARIEGVQCTARLQYWYWGSKDQPVNVGVGPLTVLKSRTFSDDPETAAASELSGFPLEAVTLGPDRHITFRRSDGTITKPLAVEWVQYVWWDADGASITVDATVPELSHLTLGTHRHWSNSLALAPIGIIEGCIWAGLIIAVVCLVTLPNFWIRLRSSQCPECAHDLRGNPDGVTGCPECGWGREANP